MTFINELQSKFEDLEKNTVSASFGGPALILEDGKKTPAFEFKPIMQWLGNNLTKIDDPFAQKLLILKDNTTEKCFKNILACLGRFSFCIELTNLKITSTKLKTRWVLGKITKTRQGTYENYEGNFSPEEDERSSSFDDCFNVFCKCVDLLVSSDVHKDMMEKLSDQKRSSTPYESVFTYSNPKLSSVHIASNIRLVELEDITWLVNARPLIKPTLRVDISGKKTKCIEKISTKCYKTDRSQTGEEQTNRAKRWECLEVDFQHATLEECWSVERKLLSDVAHFVGFPQEARIKLIESRLFEDRGYTLCPITFQPMDFTDLLGGGGHGESKFQVGHMTPLKSEGNHEGKNIEWISDDGNRIQGNLNIQDTRLMLKNIFLKMSEKGLLET